MIELALSINAGLGDNLGMRLLLEGIKHKYETIKISHCKQVVACYRGEDTAYWNFLDQFGPLVFSDLPFTFDHNDYYYPSQLDVWDLVKNEEGFIAPKPNLDHLCQGKPLNIGDYIVLTTKIRFLSKEFLTPLLPEFWETLRNLSGKYKVVILGEREVERSIEYAPFTDTIFEIYQEIINNLPAEMLVDLTVPALGITAPDITKLRQDLLIMKNAKFVINFGVGGNLWMSAAVATTVGYRRDDEFPISRIIDLLCQPQCYKMFISQDWRTFVNFLQQNY